MTTGLAFELASRLLLRLGQAFDVSIEGEPSYERTVSARIVLHVEPGRVLALVTAQDQAVRVRAGALGGASWLARGSPVDVDAIFEPVAAAIDRALTTLTLDRLVSGKRYRVIGVIPGLAKGDVVRFESFDDIDNHYGEYRFLDEHGRVVVVLEGWGKGILRPVPRRRARGPSAEEATQVDLRDERRSARPDVGFGIAIEHVTALATAKNAYRGVPAAAGRGA